MKLTVIKPLGSGGFGNVDLVEDEGGRQYARKTFSVNQPLAPDLVDNVRKRFVRESKLQSGVKHRNVVPIVYSQLTGDSPWYLMPVAETSLDKAIDIDRTLGGAYRIAVSDIVSGLDELHSMEMYHRDLKPQNVLLYKDEVSGDIFYAISDFGFVSLKDSRLSKLTYTGMKKGADYYTAPEITKSLGDASAQADIYSIGCVIHDMIGVEDRVPCGEIREDGPYGGLLLNCTRSKPDRRFKSVDVVRDVLLSIDDAAVPVQSAAAIDLAASLDSDDPLSDVALRTLAEFLEDNQGSPDTIALLRKFNIEKISASWPTEKGATKKIGFQFVEWISQPSAFDFEYCDVLTNRADAFISGGDIDIKAEMILALLVLGTSHNRWFPEKRFMAHCAPNMDQGLAKRVSVEIRARGKEICGQFDYIENSISVSRTQLHPFIVQALSETCV